jgi:hypothetical protein
MIDREQIDPARQLSGSYHLPSRHAWLEGFVDVRIEVEETCANP